MWEPRPLIGSWVSRDISFLPLALFNSRDCEKSTPTIRSVLIYICQKVWWQSIFFVLFSFLICTVFFQKSCYLNCSAFEFGDTSWSISNGNCTCVVCKAMSLLEQQETFVTCCLWIFRNFKHLSIETRDKQQLFASNRNIKNLLAITANFSRNVEHQQKVSHYYFNEDIDCFKMHCQC